MWRIKAHLWYLNCTNLWAFLFLEDFLMITKPTYEELEKRLRNLKMIPKNSNTPKRSCGRVKRSSDC